MKYTLLFTIALLLFVSCDFDEPIVMEPEVRIYQVQNKDDITIPVTIQDNRDGTGELLGNLLFSNIDSRFDATLDYVNSDRTNFSLQLSGDQLSSTFTSGTGNFTQDSIHIFISRDFGGQDFEDIFVGSR